MRNERPVPLNAAPPYYKWRDMEFVMSTVAETPMDWMPRLLFRALFQAAWRCSTRPNLPDDDKQLRNLLMVPDKIWIKHREAVRSRFKAEIVDGIAVLTHSVLQDDWAELLEYRAEQRAAIRSRWDKHRQNIQASTVCDINAVCAASYEITAYSPLPGEIMPFSAFSTEEIVGALKEAADLERNDDKLKTLGKDFFCKGRGVANINARRKRDAKTAQV